MAENGPSAGPGLNREIIQQWIEDGFQAVRVRLPGEATARHIEGHRRTIAAIVENHCPERVEDCDQLGELQRRIAGYFTFLRGESTEGQEQALIAEEMRECEHIIERVRATLTAVVTAGVVSTVSTLQEDLRPKSFPAGRLLQVWTEYVAEPLKGLRPHQEDVRLPDVVTIKAQKGFKRISLDFPDKEIDNWVYLQHARELVEAAIDVCEEELRLIGESDTRIFDCFAILGQGRRMEFALAAQRLTVNEQETLMKVYDTMELGQAPPASVRRVVQTVRERFGESYAETGRRLLALRNAACDALDQIESEINTGYRLGRPQDITEPKVWRSDYLDEVNEDVEKRVENRKHWMKEEVGAKYAKFAESRFGRQFLKAEAALFQEWHRIASDVPALLGRSDFERVKQRLDALIDSFDPTLNSRVIPHAGKAVARKIREQNWRMGEVVGMETKLMLMSSDVGQRFNATEDLEQIIQSPEPFTPEQIEELLMPTLGVIQRRHKEEFERMGRRSAAAGEASSYAMTTRMMMEELPPVVTSFQQLYTLTTVPQECFAGFLENIAPRVRQSEGGLNTLGHQLDQLSYKIFIEEYARFTERVRRRMWHTWRNSPEPKEVSPCLGQRIKRTGGFGMLSRGRMSELREESVQPYRLKNGLKELAQGMEPDLYEIVAGLCEKFDDRACGILDGLPDPIAHEELSAATRGILAAFGHVRKVMTDPQATPYLDLVEESYGFMFWHMEREMHMASFLMDGEKNELLSAAGKASAQPALAQSSDKDWEPLDLSREGQSECLMSPLQPGFDEALQRYPIDSGALRRNVQQSFSILEEKFPWVIGVMEREGKETRKDKIKALLSQCDQACVRIVAAAGETITSVEAFDGVFRRLGWVCERLENRFRGVIYHFLVARFSDIRRQAQVQTVKRVGQDEMRRVIREIKDPRLESGRYEDYFINFAQRLFVTRTKQFFFSCINPSMETDDMRRIGEAIDRLYKALMDLLAQKIKAVCAASKGGLPSMRELQACVAEAVAEVDFGQAGFSPALEDRFRVQVLHFIQNEVRQWQDPTAIFSGPSQGTEEDPASALEKELTALSALRERKERSMLRQSAAAYTTRAREAIYAMEALSISRQRGARTESRTPPVDLVGALEGVLSLYETGPVPEGMPAFQRMQTVLEGLYAQLEAAGDLEGERRVVQAIEHLTRTLVGLQRHLSPDTR